jgi:hypothetical protein
MMAVKENKAFAETIRPAVKGLSDKFSWRLFQRESICGKERIYIMAYHLVTGIHRTPDLDALKTGDGSQMSLLMVGEKIEESGWFHGAQLQHVVRKGMQKVNQSWAYGPMYNTKNWLDITDWFWAQYMIRGRCIFMHDVHAHSWIKINKNARKCEWCGDHQRRTVVTEKTIIRKDIWS